MRAAGLSSLAPPRGTDANAALWAAWIIGGAAAFAAGSALGRADEPLLVVLAAVIGALAVAVAMRPAALVSPGDPVPAAGIHPRRLGGSRSAYFLAAVAFAAGGDPPGRGA